MMADASRFTVTRIAPGTYQVEDGDRKEIVYVAGPRGDRWAFWRGEVFRIDRAAASSARRAPSARGHVAETLTAPMPATVVKVLVAPGRTVKKGDMVVVLEAMKMELPIRALGDGTVTAVHCRNGDIVRPDAPLVDIE